MDAYDGRKDSRRSVGLTLWLLLLVGWVPFAGCGEPVSAAQPTTAAVVPLEEFPFDPVGSIFLPVELDGRSYQFILDTGASLNIYDTTLKPHLGSPQGELPTMGAAGNRNLELFAPPDARVARLKLRAKTGFFQPAPQPIQCIDLSMFRKVTGEPIFGILGMDFLQRYIVQLDPDAGKIRFFPEATVAAEEWGSPVPISRMLMPNNLPLVNARIGPTDIQFIIDTADSSTGSLDQTLFDGLRDNGLLTLLGETMAETITGTSRYSTGRLKHLILGEHTQEGLIFSRSGMNRLGMGFLTRYRVTLDLPHNRLYLRPGKSVAQLEYPDMTGLHIIRDEGKTLVHSVDPDSPAQEAQIRAGDEIVEVNHKPAESYKLAVIGRMKSSAPGDRVHLRTRRDNQNQDCELTLRLFNAPPEKKP